MKKQIVINCIILVFILISFLFLLTGCSSEDTNLQSKAEKEIEHLEEKIIAMMNNLNQITLSNSVLIEEKTQKASESSKEGQNNQQSSGSGGSQGEGGGGESSKGSDSGSSSESSNSGSSKENTTEESTKYEIKNDSILASKTEEVDWENVKSSAETLHSTWATLTIDLHGLNVKNDDILNFSSVLDQVTISANNEDKTATLNNLASLYAFFPIYIEQISDNSEKINLDYTKACVLNSYALVEQNKWDEMKLQVTNAINYFTNILNGVNEDRQNQNSSKIYVLLNELSNCIDIKDKDLYMIKYRNVMEELVNFKYTNKS